MASSLSISSICSMRNGAELSNFPLTQKGSLKSAPSILLPGRRRSSGFPLFTRATQEHIVSPLPSYRPYEQEREVSPRFSGASTADAGVQKMYVYEFNENDRNSPAYLPFSLRFDLAKGRPSGGIGDLVTFTNKVYDGSLQTRLGITAGMHIMIKHYPKEKGHRYEAIFSFYFGDYGHISVQGSYLTFKDSEFAITGGSGIFTGVYGVVKLHQIVNPNKHFYTFELEGIPPLPSALTRTPVPPSASVRASRGAMQAAPGSVAPNFTD
ncbi:hypothetical protein KP509_13G076600 [Ceratopteris richardii]|uniref:allene-oxide cyclase n=1 Tax=Ceratopteris richardii TaxID=49495 RepID=A0A8T2TJ88_CERRI|nr:hypothetical protein KP509_13G076600 [Ceratopteris richardii]